MQGFSLSVTQI